MVTFQKAANGQLLARKRMLQRRQLKQQQTAQRNDERSTRASQTLQCRLSADTQRRQEVLDRDTRKERSSIRIRLDRDVQSQKRTRLRGLRKQD